jgi:hemerythrin-like domain-containing protein
MSTEELVRWLRGDHDPLPEFADRLRERIARKPRGDQRRWIDDLQTCFDDFATFFRERMAKEEANGYFKPVLEARPALESASHVLRQEHSELSRIIESIERAVHRLPPNARLLLRDACKRIEDLLSWIERHEEHENCVVLCVIGEAASLARPGETPPPRA